LRHGAVKFTYFRGPDNVMIELHEGEVKIMSVEKEMTL
jgi:hypothetical protein